MLAATSLRIDAHRWRQVADQLVDEPCDAVAHQVRVSSRGRPWNGLAVWVQRGPVGDLYIPPARKHSLVIRREASAARLQQQQGSQADERDWRCGEAILVPAGTPSFWRSDAARDNLHVNLDPAWLARAAGDDAAAAPALRSCFGIDDAVLRGFGQLLLGSLDSNASLRPAFADGQAIGLAVHLLEHHAAPANAPRRAGALTRRQFARVVEAMAAELAESWSLERLAALLDLSPFHFARAFKSTCGETPHRFLTRMRLERARELVLGSALPLIEIAVETGFASLSHFGQAYRRQWDASPGRARRGA